MADRIPPDLARRVRLVGVDVDGVLTDGGVYIGRTAGGEAVELKRFQIRDGLGIKMLQGAGIHVVMVSGRVSEATRLRAEELGVECYQHDGALKVPAMAERLGRLGIDWGDAAFLSDDLADLPVLRRVGLPVAVADAVDDVRAAALWTTRRGGGSGAVREFAEALLRARGEWRDAVHAYASALEREEEPWTRG